MAKKESNPPPAGPRPPAPSAPPAPDGAAVSTRGPDGLYHVTIQIDCALPDGPGAYLFAGYVIAGTANGALDKARALIDRRSAGKSIGLDPTFKAVQLKARVGLAIVHGNVEELIL